MPLLPRHRVEAEAFRDARRRRVSVHELQIADVTPLTADAVAITFDVPEELREAYRFRAGQHVVLLHEHEGAEIRRSYSICSPATTGELRVAVKRVPGGIFSDFAVSRLGAGQTLRVMTPTGRFSPVFEPANCKHYGAVAAGSGITPILSIVSTGLALEEKSSVTLFYANRTRASTMFAAELEELLARYSPRFELHHIRSREQHGNGAPAGRLDRARLCGLLAPVSGHRGVDDWFVCAPSEMTTEVVSVLTARGVGQERIHRELFAADPSDELSAATAADRPAITSRVTVKADGRRTEFDLSSTGEPILLAALAARPELPYACQDGICATCRAKTVEGSVVMDRCSALDRRELEQGYVLACQAHPATERVVLDFDV